VGGDTRLAFTTPGDPVTYYVSKPTTQDAFMGAGTLASGNGVEKQLEAQICAAFNRHILQNISQAATPSAFYQASPANWYAKFWHDHSLNNLAYGFCYDDVSNQSTTLVSTNPRGMVVVIGANNSTPTKTITAVNTATGTFTLTATRTATIPTATSTATATGTSSATVTYTRTSTPVNTQTYTPSTTNTAQNTATRTATAVGSLTPFLTFTATNTAVNTIILTATPSNIATATSSLTPMLTYSPSSTASVSATRTWTTTAVNTSVPTATPSGTASATPRNTLTRTATVAVTLTVLLTATPSNTATATSQDTTTPVNTPIPTATKTQDGKLVILDPVAYPNPNTDIDNTGVNIRFKLSGTSVKIKFRLFTAAYRRIREASFTAGQVNGGLTTGVNVITIPQNYVKGLAAGTYYYVLSAEDGKGNKISSALKIIIILR
jgi:hypothetical protein